MKGRRWEAASHSKGVATSSEEIYSAHVGPSSLIPCISHKTLAPLPQCLVMVKRAARKMH